MFGVNYTQNWYWRVITPNLKFTPKSVQSHIMLHFCVRAIQYWVLQLETVFTNYITQTQLRFCIFWVKMFNWFVYKTLFYKIQCFKIISDHSFTGSNNICTIIVRFGKSVPIQGAAEIWLPPNILGQYWARQLLFR